MMRTSLISVLIVLIVALTAAPAAAQIYGQPDRGAPGDEMIQTYLRQETQNIHERFLNDVKSFDDWKTLRAQYKEEYFHMLGLWPKPEPTPLQATVTRTLDGDGYVVEMLH